MFVCLVFSQCLSPKDDLESAVVCRLQTPCRKGVGDVAVSEGRGGEGGGQPPPDWELDIQTVLGGDRKEGTARSRENIESKDNKKRKENIILYVKQRYQEC